MKKSLYGLNDASGKFWFCVKEVPKVGMKVMEGDKAIYDLQGCLITHVDDFTLARTPEFIKEVLEMIEIELTISKIERDNFHFTGLDISTVVDGFEIGMADYADSFT